MAQAAAPPSTRLTSALRVVVRLAHRADDCRRASRAQVERCTAAYPRRRKLVPEGDILELLSQPPTDITDVVIMQSSAPSHSSCRMLTNPPSTPPSHF